VSGYGRRSWRGGRTGGRRGRGWLITLVLVVVLLVAADFVAKAFAESVAATEFQKQGQLSTKPDVTIEGFPFLTQLASRDFSDVKVSISNLTEGPVTITSVNATATAIRLKSFAFNSGTIGHLHGTLLINFASLGNTLTSEIGPLGALLNGAGLDVSAAGPDEVKATLNLLVATGSATWRVSRTSPTELNIHLVSSSGLPSSLLGSMQNVNVQIPKLPLGLTIDSVSVSPAGIVGNITGNDVPFGG
jgi:hypothetical protein